MENVNTLLESAPTVLGLIFLYMLGRFVNTVDQLGKTVQELGKEVAAIKAHLKTYGYPAQPAKPSDRDASSECA